jgi:hypothetical protein
MGVSQQTIGRELEILANLMHRLLAWTQVDDQFALRVHDPVVVVVGT